jgi:hypothetical protein
MDQVNRRSISLWPDGKVQNLVDPIFECDQISRYEFIAGAGEFVTMTNLENFPEARVGIEAHTIAIGNGNENKIEEFFQTH